MEQALDRAIKRSEIEAKQLYGNSDRFSYFIMGNVITHILQKAFSNRLKKIILPLVQRILSNRHIDLSDFSYAASILLFEWMSLSKNENFN